MARPGDEELQIGYLGPPGTYSHQVALSLYTGSSSCRVTLVPHPTITKTAEFALEPRPHSDHRGVSCRRQALLPLENSTHGPVTETLAVLAKYDACYTSLGKPTLAVKHALLAGRRTYETLLEQSGGQMISDQALQLIEKVTSHEQAIGQCAGFLDTYLPLTKTDGRRVHATSTASAAAQVASEGDSSTLTAAIASDICADHDVYDIVVLRRSIQDRDDNVTTFLLVESDSRQTEL